ncbi:hypothetical protein ACSBM8_10705 [Sphingomonas sp. ASY06-1R]|uniref:hypothetical protein n=1 Tax=Sphingomonas sp. ASY06-1R TaxID=3445771 RepID=UPI003FA2C0E4
MNDPVSAGGKKAVRFALSTVPALVTTPTAVVLPIGVWLHNPGPAVSTGFTLAIIVPMIVEYMRRGSLSASKPATRETLRGLITFIYVVTPLLALSGLLLSLVAVGTCFGRVCSTTDTIVGVMACVFAIIATGTSVMLIGLLRSASWAQYRAASARGAEG